MSSFQSGYVLVSLISFVLGIAFFLFDGMLLWSIAFFSLFIILVLTKIIWNISGWAERVIRKLGDE